MHPYTLVTVPHIELVSDKWRQIDSVCVQSEVSPETKVQGECMCLGFIVSLLCDHEKQTLGNP